MTPTPPSWKQWFSNPAAAGIFILFAILHLFIVVLNHYYFRTAAHDYGVYNFAFYDYAHFRVSPCPLYLAPYPISFFQDHFSLTLMLLSPLYWLLAPITGTYSILVIQWACILWGAWATYRLIAKISAPGFLAVAAMVYYFVLFGRFAAYRSDANLATMGAAVVPVFFYYFFTRKKIAAALVFVLLLVNREDFSLWLLFICGFLALYFRKDIEMRKFALALMVSSLLMFILIFSYIIPVWMEDDFKKYSVFDYDVLGATPLAALRYIIHDPVRVFQLLFINHSGVGYYDNVKAEFYIVYLISGGLLLFLRPAFLIPFIPLIAKKMLNSSVIRWSVETYYSVEVVSILPVMVFIIIAGFRRGWLAKTVASVVCILSVAVTAYKNFVQPHNPIVGESNKYNFMNPAFYTPSRDIVSLRRHCGLIPKQARVSAGAAIVPHLAFREKPYLFPRIDDAEFIILLKDQDFYPLDPVQYYDAVKSLRTNSDWLVLSEDASVVIFRRNRLTAGF